MFIRFGNLGKTCTMSNICRDFLKLDMIIWNNGDFNFVSLHAFRAREHRTQFLSNCLIFIIMLVYEAWHISGVGLLHVMKYSQSFNFIFYYIISISLSSSSIGLFEIDQHGPRVEVIIQRCFMLSFAKFFIKLSIFSHFTVAFRCKEVLENPC